MTNNRIKELERIESDLIEASVMAHEAWGEFQTAHKKALEKMRLLQSRLGMFVAVTKTESEKES